MIRTAQISNCEQYRYRLTRHWDAVIPALVYVMLNPSTADAEQDDHTIRKCIGFAERLGFGGIVVVNLFAFRATSPKDLRAAGYPIGRHNDDAIRCAVSGMTVVCAWGVNARKLQRAHDVLAMIRSMGCQPKALRINDRGIPWHPLMLPYSCTLQDIPS